MEQLRTISDVVIALGGNEKVATMLGTTYNAVGNWRARDKFPAHTYLAIRELLRRRGYTAPDRLWSMTRIKR